MRRQLHNLTFIKFKLSCLDNMSGENSEINMKTKLLWFSYTTEFHWNVDCYKVMVPDFSK